MIRFQFVILIVLQGLMAILLTRSLGLTAGFGVHALLMLASSAVSYVLLKRLSVGVINWRNRVVGLLMPWPVIVGGGSLGRLVVKNAIAALVFAAVVVGVDRSGVLRLAEASPGMAQPTMATHILSYAAVLCWIILIIAWLWVLRTQWVHNREILGSLLRSRGLLIPLLIPPIAVTLSVMLRVQGQPMLSLLTAAIPLLVVLLPVLMMCGVILAHKISGKPLRWN